MFFIPGEIYHVYNRGNNRQRIFFNDENYQFFIRKIDNQIKPHCEILSWCLMPNHFHMIILANEKSCLKRKAFGVKTMQELSYRFGILQSSYTQAINKQNHTTGSLFQQKTKAKLVDSKAQINIQNYLVNLIHYVHQNPWKAGLVKKIEEWPWSSFRAYCGLEENILCNYDLLLELTGYDKETFYRDNYGISEGFDFED